MIKVLFFVIAVLVLAESVQPTSDVPPRFRKSRFISKRDARAFDLSALTNALTNGDLQNNINNLQNNINNGMNTINEALTGINTMNDALTDLEVPKMNGIMLPVNMSAADLQLVVDLVSVNIQFFLNRTDLDANTKKVLLSIVPQLLNAKTQEDIMAILDPIILTGLGIFFQDPYIIFSKHPYLDATKRVLNMFFASPEAPEFLKDPTMQAMIISYVEKYFATNDPTMALSLATMDLFMYLNLAGGQEIKPFVQMYLPELYMLIENETDVMVMFNIVSAYAVTQLVDVYNMVMNLFSGAPGSMDGAVKVASAALQFGQRMMAQNRK